jgi:glucosyl-3-phosphoglycerate synthase
MLCATMSARARHWLRRRTFHHADFPAARLAAERELSVSICLPARNEARTIGPILERLEPLRAAGAIDQLVVVDDSSDDTAAIAVGHGAEVHAQAELRPDLGRCWARATRCGAR